MPYVNVKVGGPLTREQRKTIVTEIAELLARVAGKNPATVYTVIDEVDRDCWGVGNELLTDKDAKAKEIK
ncbi:4-oxalocrotonate tautomerase family protein [Sporomusa sphaeroides]|uniref:tautomerase family protein n=1 Tax=Sporomusa sphaeroides TaxID=47679 RepID=UPI003DA08BA8